MGKLVRGLIVAGLAIGVLAGCGAPKPTDSVNSFMTAFKDGDYKKASSYIADNGTSKGYNFKTMNEKSPDGIDGKVLFKALASKYKFEKPVEVSNNSNTAKVKVKVTSIDMQIAMTRAMGEVMPMAFASAFSEDQEKTDKQMQQLMETTLVKDLTDKNATMATRDVTLNLKKDKDGNYKIIPDKNLEEAVMANASALDKMFK